MIVEILDDDGSVREELDTGSDCAGGDDLCGGCFRCMLMQYPDMKWREKKEVPRAQIIDLFEALKDSFR
jgi:hypothetical protein